MDSCYVKMPRREELWGESETEGLGERMRIREDTRRGMQRGEGISRGRSPPS